jgi:hypothetical protein
LKNDGLVDAAAITNVNKIGNDADFETLKDISLQSCFKIVKANKV